jgi:hypothetical protein
LYAKDIPKKYGYESFSSLELDLVSKAIDLLSSDTFLEKDVLHAILSDTTLLDMLEDILIFIYGSNTLSVGPIQYSGPSNLVLDENFIAKEYIRKILHNLTRGGILTRKYKDKIPYFSKVK